jgi:hypothetical protein
VPDVIYARFRTAGSASPRARANGATGIQLAVVDAAAPAAEGEANNVPTLHVTRSPAAIDSTGMPNKVRLYARWITARGLTSPWSRAQDVVVARS